MIRIHNIIERKNIEEYLKLNKEFILQNIAKLSRADKKTDKKYQDNKSGKRIN